MTTRRFTLIELMVVIGIALLLVGLAATAYTRIAASQQVDASTATLSGALMEARQLAVSRRKHVAVLLPRTEGSTPAQKAYACYRPAYVLRVDGSPVTYTFDGWPEGSKWDFTGNSCSIMEADDRVGIEDNGSYQSTPAENTGTTVGSVDLSGVGGANPTNGVRAIIFAPSGRAAQEYYVTVGQANYLGGRWLVHKVASPLLPKNHSCANQLTLKINRFSGAVSCIRPENY